MKNLLFALILILGSVSWAHEGEHGPSSFQPQKGGVVRSLETVHLELVNKGSATEIYIYDKDGKPAKAAEYPVSASIALPKKKPEPVKLATQADHWTIEFDAKGAHRFTVNLDIKQGGHADTLKWTVEPKNKK